MKPRDRMITALSMQEPDDMVPVWEIEFHLYNKFSDRKMIYSTEYTKLTPGEQEKALQENAEIMVEVAKKVGLCGLSNIGGYWEVAPGEPAPMWLPPDDSAKFLSILRKAAGDELFIMEWCQAMILIPEADDYMEFAYMLYDHPEKVDELAKQKYDAGMEVAKRAMDAGADGLCAACDIADTRGMYFKQDQLDRYFFPYMTKWSDEVRKMGMKSILHTDGNVYEILDQIADSGIDAFQAIDPIAGMDIVKVKEMVGDRLALCGNIHLGLLQNGPIEDIKSEVQRVCENCKPGGGFVLGATNAVFEEITTENYMAMMDANREYGRYKS